MDAEKLKKSMTGPRLGLQALCHGRRGGGLPGRGAGGQDVGIGGCGTAEAIGLYDRLKAVCPDVAWHWKEEDMDAARARAMTTDAYVCSANAIAETAR